MRIARIQLRTATTHVGAPARRDPTASEPSDFDGIVTVEDPHPGPPPLAHPRLVRRSALRLRAPRRMTTRPGPALARGTSRQPSVTNDGLASDFEDAETWFRW